MRRLRPVPVVAALAGLGLVLRLLVAGQSLYADEVSTYWVTHRSFGGMLDIIANRMEITPPLSFALTWLATRASDGAYAYRTVPVLAGVAAIPIVYALGRHTVGRGAALTAAALMTVSPFAIFYSGQSRAYSLLIALVPLTALLAVIATQRGGRRWWAGYAVATAAVMLTHYTGVFALAAIFAWVMIARPGARRPCLVATIGAVVLFAPWGVTGFINDLRSPDTVLASFFVDFTPKGVARSLAHWLIGHPAGESLARSAPGPVGLPLIAFGLLAGAAGLIARRPGGPSAPLVLVALLAVATPVGQIISSAVASPSYTTNSLAASTGGAALLAGALTQAAVPRLRVIAAVALVAGIAVTGVRAVLPSWARLDFGPAARMIDSSARPDDIVLDASGAGFGTPGPLTPLDLAMASRPRIVRFGVPQQRESQFYEATELTLPGAIRAAVRRTGRDGRLFVVFPEPIAFGPTSDPVPLLRQAGLPADFRLVRRRTVTSRLGRTDALLFAR